MPYIVSERNDFLGFTPSVFAIGRDNEGRQVLVRIDYEKNREADENYSEKLNSQGKGDGTDSGQVGVFNAFLRDQFLYTRVGQDQVSRQDGSFYNEFTVESAAGTQKANTDTFKVFELFSISGESADGQARLIGITPVNFNAYSGGDNDRNLSVTTNDGRNGDAITDFEAGFAHNSPKTNADLNRPFVSFYTFDVDGFAYRNAALNVVLDLGGGSGRVSDQVFDDAAPALDAVASQTEGPVSTAVQTSDLILSLADEQTGLVTYAQKAGAANDPEDGRLSVYIGDGRNGDTPLDQAVLFGTRRNEANPNGPSDNLNGLSLNDGRYGNDINDVEVGTTQGNTNKNIVYVAGSEFNTFDYFKVQQSNSRGQAGFLRLGDGEDGEGLDDNQLGYGAYSDAGDGDDTGKEGYYSVRLRRGHEGSGLTDAEVGFEGNDNGAGYNTQKPFVAAAGNSVFVAQTLNETQEAGSQAAQDAQLAAGELAQQAQAQVQALGESAQASVNQANEDAQSLQAEITRASQEIQDNGQEDLERFQVALAETITFAATNTDEAVTDLNQDIINERDRILSETDQFAEDSEQQVRDERANAQNQVQANVESAQAQMEEQEEVVGQTLEQNQEVVNDFTEDTGSLIADQVLGRLDSEGERVNRVVGNLENSEGNKAEISALATETDRDTGKRVDGVFRFEESTSEVDLLNDGTRDTYRTVGLATLRLQLDLLSPAANGDDSGQTYGAVISQSGKGFVEQGADFVPANSPTGTIESSSQFAQNLTAQGVGLVTGIAGPAIQSLRDVAQDNIDSSLARVDTAVLQAEQTLDESEAFARERAANLPSEFESAVQSEVDRVREQVDSQVQAVNEQVDSVLLDLQGTVDNAPIVVQGIVDGAVASGTEIVVTEQNRVQSQIDAVNEQVDQESDRIKDLASRTQEDAEQELLNAQVQAARVVAAGDILLSGEGQIEDRTIEAVASAGGENLQEDDGQVGSQTAALWVGKKESEDRFGLRTGQGKGAESGAVTSQALNHEAGFYTNESGRVDYSSPYAFSRAYTTAGRNNEAVGRDDGQNYVNFVSPIHFGKQEGTEKTSVSFDRSGLNETEIGVEGEEPFASIQGNEARANQVVTDSAKSIEDLSEQTLLQVGELVAPYQAQAEELASEMSSRTQAVIDSEGNPDVIEAQSREVAGQYAPEAYAQFEEQEQRGKAQVAEMQAQTEQIAQEAIGSASEQVEAIRASAVQSIEENMAEWQAQVSSAITAAQEVSTSEEERAQRIVDQPDSSEEEVREAGRLYVPGFDFAEQSEAQSKEELARQQADGDQFIADTLVTVEQTRLQSEQEIQARQAEVQAQIQSSMEQADQSVEETNATVQEQGDETESTVQTQADILNETANSTVAQVEQSAEDSLSQAQAEVDQAPDRADEQGQNAQTLVADSMAQASAEYETQKAAVESAEAQAEEAKVAGESAMQDAMIFATELADEQTGNIEQSVDDAQGVPDELAGIVDDSKRAIDENPQIAFYRNRVDTIAQENTGYTAEELAADPQGFADSYTEQAQSDVDVLAGQIEQQITSQTEIIDAAVEENIAVADEVSAMGKDLAYFYVQNNTRKVHEAGELVSQTTGDESYEEQTGKSVAAINSFIAGVAGMSEGYGLQSALSDIGFILGQEALSNGFVQVKPMKTDNDEIYSSVDSSDAGAREQFSLEPIRTKDEGENEQPEQSDGGNGSGGTLGSRYSEARENVADGQTIEATPLADVWNPLIDYTESQVNLVSFDSNGEHLILGIAGQEIDINTELTVTGGSVELPMWAQMSSGISQADSQYGAMSAQGSYNTLTKAGSVGSQTSEFSDGIST